MLAKRGIDAALGLIVVALSLGAGFAVISALDKPPTEVRGAIAIQPVIKRGERLDVRELVIKRTQCPSTWTVNIIERGANRQALVYQEPGGFAPLSEEPTAVIWSVKTQTLPPGKYVLRAYGRFDGCGSLTRAHWVVSVPDVYFEVR